MMKFLNRAAAVSVYSINLYYIPLSMVTAWGCLHGAVAQPIFFDSLVANALIIPATFTFQHKHQSSWVLLLANAMGLAYTVFWLALLLTVPRMD